MHFNYFCHDEASDHDSHGKHSIITSTIEGELCSEADENTLSVTVVFVSVQLKKC